MKRRILVVDIGGSFVKLLMSERVEREFASGPRMTPKQFLAKFKETVRGWKFDVASIGFPAPVRNGRILRNRSTWVRIGSILILPQAGNTRTDR
jgi:hypothetical protein